MNRYQVAGLVGAGAALAFIGWQASRPKARLTLPAAVERPAAPVSPARAAKAPPPARGAAVKTAASDTPQREAAAPAPAPARAPSPAAAPARPAGDACASAWREAGSALAAVGVAPGLQWGVPSDAGAAPGLIVDEHGSAVGFYAAAGEEAPVFDLWGARAGAMRGAASGQAVPVTVLPADVQQALAAAYPPALRGLSGKRSRPALTRLRDPAEASAPERRLGRDGSLVCLWSRGGARDAVVLRDGAAASAWTGLSPELLSQAAAAVWEPSRPQP